MSIISKIIQSKINTPVGNGKESNPEDVIVTRKNFHRIGRYSSDINRPYIDKDLDQTIRRFQKDMNLREDGKMLPNGETEKALNKLLYLAQSDSAESSNMPAVPPGDGSDIQREPAPSTTKYSRHKHS